MAVECTGRNVEVTPRLRAARGRARGTTRAAPRRPRRGPRRPVAREAPVRRGSHRHAPAQALDGAGGDRGPEIGGRPRLRENRRAGQEGFRAPQGPEAPRGRRGPAAAAGDRRNTAKEHPRGLRSDRQHRSPGPPRGGQADDRRRSRDADGGLAGTVVVFRDSGSDRVSVLYKRRDGDFGLIVPEC